MSLKVFKNQNLLLNSLKTVTCIQKDLMLCTVGVRGQRSGTQYCFAPGISNPALASPICWSGQRSATRYIFVLFYGVCYSQSLYVDVNLSLKMSLNLKIFGVVKNIFYSGRHAGMASM